MSSMIMKIAKRTILGILLSLLLLGGADSLITACAEGKTFSNAADTPEFETAVLLGSGKTLANGRLNRFYQYRIEAVKTLWSAGKIKKIIISGDNSRKDYDEPSMFKADLIAAGIPSDSIWLDFAGFRTLDSVLRAQTIFGQNKVLFISQKFHNERAIWIAESHGMEAYGFNAQDVEMRHGLKIKIREVFARFYAILDTHLFGTQPRFGGDPVRMTISTPSAITDLPASGRGV